MAEGARYGLEDKLAVPMLPLRCCRLDPAQTAVGRPAVNATRRVDAAALRQGCNALLRRLLFQRIRVSCGALELYLTTGNP